MQDGQGHETTFAQVIADQLGVAIESVIVRHGDTLGAPQSIGTFGSRSAGLGGSALARAATEVRDKGRRLAAHLLEVSPEDLQLMRGGFQVKGAPEKTVSWERLGDVAHRPVGLPPGESPGLDPAGDRERGGRRALAVRRHARRHAAHRGKDLVRDPGIIGA